LPTGGWGIIGSGSPSGSCGTQMLRPRSMRQHVPSDASITFSSDTSLGGRKVRRVNKNTNTNNHKKKKKKQKKKKENNNNNHQQQQQQQFLFRVS
jgi:hypothetical protein